LLRLPLRARSALWRGRSVESGAQQVPAVASRIAEMPLIHVNLRRWPACHVALVAQRDMRR